MSQTALVITTAAIAIFAMLYAAVLLRLKKLRNQAVAEVTETLRGHNVSHMIPAANSFGQETLGIIQIRGTGTLAFTTQEIYFLMWMPKRTLRIPLKSILSVETTKSHLAKTKFKDLLKVVFTNEDGKTDSVAWQVTNLAHDMEKLKDLLTTK